jgi:hypothetical protein
MPTPTANFGRETALSPPAMLMDQLVRARTNRARKKHHLARVISSLILAVGLWLVIYAVSGRVIWIW